MTHVINVFHGIGASLACAACFYLAGHVLVPRTWDASLRHAGFPVIGAALYVLLCWIAISAQRVPLNLVATVFVAGVLALSVLRVRRVVAAVKAGIASGQARLKSRTTEAIAWFVLFYVLAYVTTRPPAADIFLPPAWSGNIDLVTHIRYAKHLLMFGSPDLEAASFDYLRSPAASHVLAGFSVAYGQDPLSAAMPAQFALTALIGVAIVGICRSIFHLPRLAAVTIGCIFLTSSYFRDVASAYRLATLISIPILLFILWVTARARSDRAVDGPLIGVLTSAYALLFFTDVPALVAAVTLQAIAILVFAASGLKVRGIAVSSAISASIVALAFVDRLQWSVANLYLSDGVAAVVLALAVALVAGATYLARREDVLNRFAATPADRRLAVAAGGYAAIAIIAGNVAVHAARNPVLARMPGRWRGIEQLKSLNFGELTLKIEHDPNGLLTAVTRYFLPDRKVHVIAPRVRVRDLRFETISRQSPILIQNFGCDGVGHADAMTVSGVGCAMFAPPAFELDTQYPFNRTFLFLAFDGMTDREPGGRWNIGRTLSLRLKVDPERTRVDRNLHVNFHLNPFLPPGVKSQRLVFKWGRNRTGETIVDTGDWISLPISAGDWTGNRVWTLRISVGLPHGRTIHFHDLSVSQKPRGRLVQ